MPSIGALVGNGRCGRPMPRSMDSMRVRSGREEYILGDGFALLRSGMTVLRGPEAARVFRRVFREREREVRALFVHREGKANWSTPEMMGWIEQELSRLGDRWAIAVRRLSQAAIVPAVPRERQELPVSVQPTTFVELQMCNDSGDPIAGLRYELTLPDRTTRSGALDSQGRARIDGIARSGECSVVFIDDTGYEFAESAA